jgi:hypothetical protein
MTEAQPLSLSEAQLDGLDERLVEVKTSLIHGFPIASAEQHLLWETRLKEIQNVSILYEVIVSIRKTMKDNEKTKNFKAWVPKGHIVQVIQAYYNKQYSDEDLEYIFPKYGDINGILVLYLGTRSQNHLFTKINMLPQDLKVVLAKQCGKEKIPSKLLPDWLNSYDKSPKGMFFLA